MSGNSSDTWEKRSLVALKNYYLSFAGTQWHEFKRSSETSFLRVKIAFAMYGPPTTEAEEIENAYNDEQRKKAQEIMDIILKVNKDSGVGVLRVGFVFIMCKQENVFALPVFSVFVGTNRNGKDLRKFVDTQGRTYKDWNDWKENNCLPKLDYAYPKRGYFTCSGNDSYEFDREKDPDIEFGSSPQSSVASNLLKAADVSSTIFSIGSGIIGIAACFTPIAPVVLTAAAVTGASSTVYGASRGISNLVDKGTHGQSLTDFESLITWFSVIATPFHFLTSTVNGTLAAGAQQGRIFNNSMMMYATVLNCMTCGLDTTLFGFGFASLIQKAIDKELAPLDVLQFSMSAYFFTNTLIQPKVASKIIRQAQDMHIDKVASSMTDDGAKQIFDKFLQNNKVEGSITERSKIVRAVNRMNDPSKFFKSAGPDATLKIADRTGKTVLVGDKHGHTTRVNPNRFNAMSTADCSQVTFNVHEEFKRIVRNMKNDPKDVVSNRVRLFLHLNDMPKRNVGRAIATAAVKNRDMIRTATDIADKMGYTSWDELQCVTEILVIEVEGKSGDDQTVAINQLQTTYGRSRFIEHIRKNEVQATNIARRGGLYFENKLMAVYHYRKHGADFARRIIKFGNTLNVYLGPVRKYIFQASNMHQVCHSQDGTVRHIYRSSENIVGVITSIPGEVKISTMFRSLGESAQFANGLAQFFQNHVPQSPPEPVSDVSASLAKFMGINAFHVSVSINGTKMPIDECVDLDPNVRKETAVLLTAFMS